MAFAAQMRALGRSLVPVRAEDVAAAAMGRSAPPLRAAWITFDDGYRDVLTNVLPILEREHIPATFFARVPGEDDFPSWAPLDLGYQVLGRVTICRLGRPLAARGESANGSSPRSYGDQIAGCWPWRRGTAWTLEARREDVYLSGREVGSSRPAASRSVATGPTTCAGRRWTRTRWSRGPPERRLARRPGTSARASPTRMRRWTRGSPSPHSGWASSSGSSSSNQPATTSNRRLAVRRLVAKDDERWVERLASELEGA